MKTFAALWILAVFVLPLALPFLLSRIVDDGTGGGGGYASVSSGSILAVAFVGFAVGFWWKLRRERNRESGAVCGQQRPGN